MKNSFAIARISFKEGLRHRVLYGMGIFAFLVMIFSVLISGLFMRDICKVILDFSLAAVNIGGLLVPLFLGVHLMARDLERKTIYSILSKPISRSEYILGKFGGLILLTGLVMGILSVAAFASVFAGKALYGDRFFSTLSIPSILISVCCSYLGMIMLNSMVILWCSITTSSFLATLLILATYVVGQTVEDVVRFLSVKTPGVEIDPVLQKAVWVIQYLFPNLAAFDLKLEAAHGLIIPSGKILLLTAYSGVYSVAILCLSILLFQRRDLP